MQLFGRRWTKGRWIQGRWIQGAVMAIAIGATVSPMPVHAQSDQQVRSLVEALRLAAPRTGNPNDGLYSEWQIQAQNIPRWSESCTGRRLTPQQFEADSATARSILSCVMRDVLQEEYGNSSNEAIVVRRVAAWWMTGDSSRYDSGETAAYTQRVLGFYEQQAANSPDNSTGNNSTENNSTGNSPTGNNSTENNSTGNSPNRNNSTENNANPAQSTPYDRYMQAGYTAVQARNYESALLNFRRALDERPNDAYAQRAIENVERYQSGQTGG